ncbi:MAG TPA: carboxypeptidase-like regulatory domain-containing protein [Candidatus Thermoplasmatota archaeon]|nr:carboxypeptidase-like regulatory domain-containing protein [Candidatus Thermoplasmatota archaeon]
MRTQPLLLLALLSAALLAGCAGGGSPEPLDEAGEDAPELEVTDTTGGIRGIVVDQSIVPVAGAKVTLSGGPNTTTDEEGLFRFTALEPGDYFVAVSKPGYTSVQQAATVVAGVADPPIVKVLLNRLTTAQPYLDFYKLDGFYECGFALPFITDSCDFGWRTGYDGVNESTGSPPPVIPRSPTAFSNTQFIDVPVDTWTIIQEAFWTDETVTAMMISLDETPIDNACDCSDSYMNEVMAQPTYSRMDTFDEETGATSEPAGVTAAARGFLPFGDPQYALNFRFVVITSLFHNYPAPEGWTFETKDQYPVG